MQVGRLNEIIFILIHQRVKRQDVEYTVGREACPVRSWRSAWPRLLLLSACLSLLGAAGAAGQGTGQWVELGSMPRSNAEFGAARIGGLIYVAGGFADESALRIYDPATDSWSDGEDLPNGNHHPAVIGFGGKLYVIGGFDTESMVQIYDPATDSWSFGAEVPTPRRAMAIVELDDRIHIIGGTDGDSGGGGRAEHEIYDPVADTWEIAAPLLEGRDHGYAGVVRRKIYFASGRLNLVLQDDLQIYDPDTDSWSLGPPLPTAASGHAVQVVDNRLYVFGGEDVPNGAVTRASQQFDPAAGSWTLVTELPHPLHAAASAVFGGSIYLFGGTSFVEPDSQGTQRVLRFDPPIVVEVIAPRKLKAKILSSTEVRLRWKFKTQRSDARRILIQRKKGDRRFRRAARVTPDVKRKVLGGLEPGATYTFRVRALGPSGKSAWSNERTVTLPD